jgi:cytochrome c biogenesis protein CcdA
VNELATLLREALSGGALVALPLALSGGVVTGLNPCCLALYPAAAGTCCAVRGGQRVAFSNAAGFVLGVSFATAALGVGAAVLGGVLTNASGWSAYAIAGVPLLMGMHVLGWIRLPLPRGAPVGRRSGFVGAFLVGLVLWAVIAPCGTPILAAMLSYSAYQGSVAYGALLLFFYGLGAGLPVLVLGTVFGDLAARLDARGWGGWVNGATGGVLVALAFYLVWNA